MSSRTPAEIVFDQPHLVSNIESHLTYAYGIHPVAKIFWDAIREKGTMPDVENPAFSGANGLDDFDRWENRAWRASRLVDYDDDDRYKTWDICIFLGGPFSHEDEHTMNEYQWLDRIDWLERMEGSLVDYDDLNIE